MNLSSALSSLLFASSLAVVACGGGGGASPDAGGGGSDGDAGSGADASSTPGADAAVAVPIFTELWYSVDDRLIRVVLDTADGSVVELVPTMLAGMEVGHNCLTMLDDGSLLGARLSEADGLTYLFHIAAPPRDGGTATATQLGVMPDTIKLEGLYTDCDGRVYAMDTGADASSSTGNRLLRFTGDFLNSDFNFTVVSDLSSATVADIDDMGPAIVDNEIKDNPGLAIDSGTVYDFDYETGTGTMSGAGGDWGIHALGKELFTDGTARLYVLNSNAELFEMDPNTYALSDVLVTGPGDVNGFAGWSGLAGPLTECDSGFDVD